MRLIKNSASAREVSARWDRQYRQGSSAKITSALHALPDNASAEQINSIIGNSSWTEPAKCSECEEKGHTFVVFTEDEYDEYTTWICPKCISGAATLLLT